MIVVDHLSRLGRRGPERLKVLYELDRLNVKVLVVSKQRADEPGIVRYVQAWQDEEYLREQARKTISNMPRVIKAGKHPAPTPIGYRRVYPTLETYDRKVQSVLVKDDHYGPLVQSIFRDYAGGTSIRDIVYALNAGPLPNPKARDGKWSYDTVRGMLSRKVYIGLVEWGREHVGEWGPY
jgi:DNA invertase Pin-like site-specific DNA recombinase